MAHTHDSHDQVIESGDPAAQEPRRFQVSLRTLLLTVLLIGSAGVLWHNWHPWVVEHTLNVHPRESGFAVFSPDGRFVATADTQNSIKLWNAHTGAATAVMLGHKNSVFPIAFSPDGTRIVSPSFDGTARVWNTDDGTAAVVLDGHRDWVVTAQFSPDGRTIMTDSIDGDVFVWDAANGHPRYTLAGHNSKWVSGAQFSPDGRWILLTGNKGVVRIVDAQSGIDQTTLDIPNVSSTRFSRDGQWLATISNDKVLVWDTDKYRMHAILSGHTNKVSAVMFSPDSQQLLTGGADGTARLWDRATGNELLVLQGHAHSVGTALFVDRRTVATSDDRTVRIWDITSGASTTLKTPEGTTDVSIAPDGRRIATVSYDGPVQIWTCRRPLSAYGVFVRPELWLTLAFMIGLSASLYRDWRRLHTCADARPKFIDGTSVAGTAP